MQTIFTIWYSLFGIGLLFALYFLPGIVASARDKRSKLAIWILNGFVGWSVIGWIGALVWAFTKDAPV